MNLVDVTKLFGLEGQIFTSMMICFFHEAISPAIVHITPYVITNIWTFPDGRVKVRQKMTEEPYSIIDHDDAEWFISDWYPAIGETRADWLEACQRAGAFNDYGDP